MSVDDPFEERVEGQKQLYMPEQIQRGVLFTARYVGCTQINTSMKLLPFKMRSGLVKECIFAVAEAACLAVHDRRRKPNRGLTKYMSDKPILDFAGHDVSFTVSSESFVVASLDTGRIIAQHSMQVISFASGGEGTIADFIAYVAKDDAKGRCCFVLECLGGTSTKVITAIGLAFQLRYNEVVQHGVDSSASRDMQLPLRSGSADEARGPSTANEDDGQLSPLVSPVAQTPSTPGSAAARPGVQPRRPYENDIFQPSMNYTHMLLRNERWYHGRIDRSQAEQMLQKDGDFLVRQSTTEVNQFVLSGIQNGVPKHLALVDGDGCVRTKDRLFDHVLHLIQYHVDNNLPIVSRDSALLLKNAMLRNYNLT